MKSLIIILILLLSVVLQTSFWPFLRVYGAMPNLVLVLILGWIVLAFYKDFKPSQKLWPIILAGFFLDLFSGLPFGVLSLSLLAVVYSIDWFIKNVFSRINFWSLTALAIIATLFYNLFLISLTKLFIVVGDVFLISGLNSAFQDLVFLEKRLGLVGFYLVYSIPLEIIYNIILIWLIFYLRSERVK